MGCEEESETLLTFPLPPLHFAGVVAARARRKEQSCVSPNLDKATPASPSSQPAAMVSSQPWTEKYRPRTVSDVCFQTQVVDTLTKALESANVSGRCCSDWLAAGVWITCALVCAHTAAARRKRGDLLLRTAPSTSLLPAAATPAVLRATRHRQDHHRAGHRTAALRVRAGRAPVHARMVACTAFRTHARMHARPSTRWRHIMGTRLRGSRVHACSWLLASMRTPDS